VKAALALCLLATLLAAPAATAQDAPQKLRWLALGDSYSSGEGIYGAGNGHVYGSDDPCARSVWAWPRLAATWVDRAADADVRAVFDRFGSYLGADTGKDVPDYDVDMTFLACSGAESTEQDNDVEDLDEQLSQTDGLYDVITFSFGGNDSHFGPIITSCLNPADGGGCSESEATMTGRIQNEVAPKLDAAYRKIRKHLAPGGRVIVNGYPRLFDKPWLRASCFGTIPRGDIEMLRRVADVLNATIHRLATANDFDYVDVATPFEGRNACGFGFNEPITDLAKWAAKEQFPFEFTPACLGMKWVNGVSAGLEAGLREKHSFHPNLCGHVVESLVVAHRVLGWRATGDALAKPRSVDLYHGGLSVRIGDHEALQYQYGAPVAPIADHLTQLFGLPGPEDTVPVDPGACGLADGMTWDVDGAPVLTICVRGNEFIGFIQHEGNPAITTRDGVTAGAKVWWLLANSGGRLAYTDESKRIGGTVVVKHSYFRCDVEEFGDPPQEGRLRSPDDWAGQVVEVWDIAGSISTCGSSRPETEPEPVDAERYHQGSFYFFTPPDGSYQCGIAQDTALCQGETQPVPPKPEDCQVGWGYGMSVDGTGKADFLCAGGLIYGPLNRNPDDRDKLPSGRSITAFGFTCTAADDARIRCTHDATGHGFLIAPTTNDRF
jgi:hypothetical protein